MSASAARVQPEKDLKTRVPAFARETSDVEAEFGADVENGLTSEEAAARLAQYGPNELDVSEGVRWHNILLRQFADVLVAILLLAAFVSAFVGDPIDAAAILAIVLLNALLGFTQEWKAERALAALRRMLTLKSAVIRDGQQTVVEASEIVPGDIVAITVGDRVPADLRLVDAVNLQLDESTLTGESAPVEKQDRPVVPEAPLPDQRSMAWTGSAVTNGHGTGIAVATGKATEFGKIASLTQAVDVDPTPLQRKLAGLGKQLGVLAIALAAIIAVTGWQMGKPPLEMFMTGVSLAVAVVPEGLPAVVTLTMALGVRSMVRRRALLRRLQAAESLGAATVICTDKTGTLTQNQMTVEQIWLPAETLTVTGKGYAPIGQFQRDGKSIDPASDWSLVELLRTAVLCSHASLERDSAGWIQVGEPTEAALVVAAAKTGVGSEEDREVLTEFSFDSTRKRMTVVVQDDGALVAHSKGAPEVLLERCSSWQNGADVEPLTKEAREQVENACRDMGAKGLRTIALARRTLPTNSELDEEFVETDLTLLGVAGMSDPPREEAPHAIQLAQSAGVRVIMITGDAVSTALGVAHRIGLPAKKALTGQDLERIDDDQLTKALQDDVVFARTMPEHKLRIVRILQSLGHVVGMTGDGVNDAPALKKADIGIAMGLRGTEVAKGAADLVLTDDNFSSIVGAMEEGRRQYDNIQKFVRYLLSSNTGEIIAIFCNILLGGPLIFLPVQILWMNLITDGVTAIALGVEPGEKSAMQRPPRDPRQALLDWRGMLMVAAFGSYIGLVTLWLFQRYLHSTDPREIAVAGTVAFTAIVLMEKINVLNFRSLREPIARIGFFSNPWILVAVTAMIALQVAAVYVPVLQRALHTTPLTAGDWGRILAAAAPIFLMGELAKRWTAFRQRTSAADGV